ncbi:MAG: hypothetical protein KIG32_07465 [Ruminiclostridium sp.]|nr:hypothetical protein [Ruminiclostridium sp.]
MNEISADYIKAQELDRRIKTSAQLAQQSLYEMCMGFKEMRDSRLYKELGYSDFEDYCEKETGFKRANVYNYISVAENLPKEFVQTSRQIGVSKLLLLAKLSDEDRTEITETTDLEGVTVRELKGKIKALEEKADNAQALADKLTKSENKAWGKVSILETDKEYQRARIEQLEAEIKELESRPIDVPAADSHELENLKDAMKRIDRDWSEKYAELEEANIKDRRELLQKADAAEKDKQEKIAELKAELDRVRSEYEARLAEKPQPEPADESKVKFKVLLSAAYDALTRAAEFATASEEFKDKLRQLISAVDKKLEG